MKFHEKIAIGICLLVGFGSVATFSLFQYIEYQKNQEEELELQYFTETEWEWHDKYNRIQIAKKKPSKFLRKVSIDKDYIIYAKKNEDYTLSAIVVFPTSCTPNTTIKTLKRFPDNSAKELKCNSAGDALWHSVWWDQRTVTRWSDNLGGFSFHADFVQWDFSELDRQITLGKQVSENVDG
tara:strand:- start:76 stop:618 length:543 start_codon:yes stop_codon:yes gene_type:complete